MTAVEQLAEAQKENTRLQGEATESKRLATEAATNLQAKTTEAADFKARADKAEGDLTAMTARATKAEGDLVTMTARAEKAEKDNKTTDEKAREQNSRVGLNAHNKSDGNVTGAGEDIAAIAAKLTNPETSMSEKAEINRQAWRRTPRLRRPAGQGLTRPELPQAARPLFFQPIP